MSNDCMECHRDVGSHYLISYAGSGRFMLCHDCMKARQRLEKVLTS